MSDTIGLLQATADPLGWSRDRRLGMSCSKQVSQSCTVTKSETFWQATRQSNLVYKWMAATKASKVWCSYSHSCTAAIGAVFHSVCQVWLSSGLPESSAFMYCAWLWNWLIPGTTHEMAGSIDPLSCSVMAAQFSPNLIQYIFLIHICEPICTQAFFQNATSNFYWHYLLMVCLSKLPH